MKIAGVVITYNRLDLLKKVIEGLTNQSVFIDKIFIVNNDSTDGTTEWLSTIQNQRIEVVNQENVGGAGGFKTGVQKAFAGNFDWIWAMDDDVVPKVNCLEELLKYAQLPDLGILLPSRFFCDKPFITEYEKINLSNPFTHWGIRRIKASALKENKTISVQTMTFEGPLIKKEVIRDIGFPDSNYFILYDDTDYAYRAIKHGYKIYMISSARMDRISLANLSNKFGWKNLYDIHNAIIFDRKYGRNFFVKYFRSFSRLRMYSLSYLSNVLRNDRFKKNDIIYMFKAFIRAHSGKPANYKK